MMTLQVCAPHLTAGIVVDPHKDAVVAAAPILAYMIGWSRERAMKYIGGRGWSVLDCSEEDNHEEEIQTNDQA